MREQGGTALRTVRVGFPLAVIVLLATMVAKPVLSLLNPALAIVPPAHLHIVIGGTGAARREALTRHLATMPLPTVYAAQHGAPDGAPRTTRYSPRVLSVSPTGAGATTLGLGGQQILNTVSGTSLPDPQRSDLILPAPRLAIQPSVWSPPSPPPKAI